MTPDAFTVRRMRGTIARATSRFSSERPALLAARTCPEARPGGLSGNRDRREVQGAHTFPARAPVQALAKSLRAHVFKAVPRLAQGVSQLQRQPGSDVSMLAYRFDQCRRPAMVGVYPVDCERPSETDKSASLPLRMQEAPPEPPARGPGPTSSRRRPIRSENARFTHRPRRPAPCRSAVPRECR